MKQDYFSRYGSTLKRTVEYSNFITCCIDKSARKESNAIRRNCWNFNRFHGFGLVSRRFDVNSAKSSDEQIGEITQQKKPKQEVNPRRSRRRGLSSKLKSKDFRWSIEGSDHHINLLLCRVLFSHFLRGNALWITSNRMTLTFFVNNQSTHTHTQRTL